MARYEASRASPRLERGWEVFEHDGSVNGRAVAGDMHSFDAERVAALLNATQPGGGGGTLAVLTDDELDALSGSLARELERRAKEGNTGLWLSDDELDELNKRKATEAKPTAPQAKTPRQLPAKDDSPWETVGGVTKPRVGVGASAGAGSDSYPYTIVGVSPSGHKIELRGDNARVVSGSFERGDARVEFFDAYGPGVAPGGTIIATRRRGECDEAGNPRYRLPGRRGSLVTIGRRHYYRDPSF